MNTQTKFRLAVLARQFRDALDTRDAANRAGDIYASGAAQSRADRIRARYQQLLDAGLSKRAAA